MRLNRRSVRGVSYIGRGRWAAEVVQTIRETSSGAHVDQIRYRVLIPAGYGSDELPVLIDIALQAVRNHQTLS